MARRSVDPTAGHPAVKRGRMVLLGMDPGFASFGVCALAIDEKTPIQIERFAVLRTQKENKKAKLLATEDNLRRCKEIADELEDVFRELEESGCVIVAIAAESMSFPRSASVAAKMAMSWGVVVAMANVRGLPILQATPQAIKRGLCGSIAASKEEVQTVCRETIPSVAAHASHIVRGQQEHPYDALAAALVARAGDYVTMVRRSS